jgi:hypothetical protein
MCQAGICAPLGLAWTLGEFQIVDLTGNFDIGCRQLLRVWGVEYKIEAKKSRRKKKRNRKRVWSAEYITAVLRLPLDAQEGTPT